MRLYEADCPRIGAPLTQQIDIVPISPNLAAAEDLILRFPGVSTGDGKGREGKGRKGKEREIEERVQRKEKK